MYAAMESSAGIAFHQAVDAMAAVAPDVSTAATRQGLATARRPRSVSETRPVTAEHRLLACAGVCVLFVCSVDRACGAHALAGWRASWRLRLTTQRGSLAFTRKSGRVSPWAGTWERRLLVVGNENGMPARSGPDGTGQAARLKTATYQITRAR